MYIKFLHFEKMYIKIYSYLLFENVYKKLKLFTFSPFITVPEVFSVKLSLLTSILYYKINACY